MNEVQNKLKESISSELSSSLKEIESGAWEYGLTYELDRDNALEVFEKLKSSDSLKFNMLVELTAVDYMDSKEDRFTVVYHLMSTTNLYRITIKINVAEDDAWVESVLPLWKSANFLEREVWDLFGIDFKNHGDLRRIMMYEEFEGHPLRKDYPILKKQPRIPLRLPELHNTAQDMKRNSLVAMPTKKSSSKSEAK